ncbi:MAG: GDSL-type esterase/lipase family protein [Pseudomonadota bacterium]
MLRALGVLVAFAGAGCAQDPQYGSGGPDAGAATGGAPNTGGTGGIPGGGGSSPPACDPTRSTLGKIGATAAAPWVSVGKPVVASAGVVDAGKVVDGLYPHAGAFLPNPTAQAPAWLAVDMGAGAGPGRLLLSWADTGWNEYNTPIPGGSPASYRIETSADSTNGADGTWNVVVDVPTNKVRERAHSFLFANKRWVKLVVTGAANAGASKVGVSLDEVALFNVTQAADARPADTWFFMGDSITSGGFKRQLGAGTSFEALIKAKRPAFTPAMLNGGIGGELSTMGLGHLNEWLELNPDLQHIAILYGTNDSWDVAATASTNLDHFTASMTGIVEAILAGGRVPILARIPYASTHHPALAPFNAAIDGISTAHALPCGPDLYNWFKDHPDELGPDGVHPSDAGYRSINRLWADAMLGLYPAP